MSTPQKFWMVARYEGGGAPNKRHTTLADAKAEAERLTRKEYAIFIVLEAVTYVRTAQKQVPVVWETPETPTVTP